MDPVVILVLFLIIGLIVFISLSAFVSAIETSYTAINLLDWKVYLQSNNTKAKRSSKIVSLLLSKYSITVALALTFNNLLAVGAGLFSQVMLTHILSDNPLIANTLSLILVSVFLVVFGDFLPKNYVRKYAIKFAVKTSYLTFMLWVLFYPVSYLLATLVPKIKEDKISREYLDKLTNVALDDDVFDQHEAELVSCALELDNKYVKDFMNQNPICVQLSNSINDYLKVYHQYQYTRVVVLDDSRNVYGLMNFKILLGLMLDSQGNIKDVSEHEINEIIQDVLYLPASVKLDEGLRQMQKFQAHLAVVVTSPGSKDMIGVISIEDIIEELVGEIYDENDEDLDIKQINDFIYVINPNAPASGVVDALNLKTELILEPKDKARHLFSKMFATQRLKLNDHYENATLSIKVDKELDSGKYRYYVTMKSN